MLQHQLDSKDIEHDLLTATTSNAAQPLTFKGNKTRNGRTLGVAAHGAMHHIDMDCLANEFKGNKNKTRNFRVIPALKAIVHVLPQGVNCNSASVSYACFMYLQGQ